MSAIAFERPFADVADPTARPANEACSREEEFRATLDSYIARYVAEQAKRAPVVGCSNNPYSLIWLQPLRRLLEAIREIWLFSNELGDRPMPEPVVVCGAKDEPGRGFA
ncbi:hypothetical protein GCM10007874_11010 [Labrys miyagiensis]|uniref:Uncharacterized protein n=1 Tax=Labrys miyagiensis TaxID=346912 RepID=A0ABQ6CGV3_9HYPH|nr:hypothetical protein [Labrys miyagiensis]GLS18085.1 hypothetical protein GCM10007874_11010 [Labrys miyagiensis]